METLVFDGLKEYTLKVVGEAVVCFNPTDINFIERVFNTFDKMDAMQERYSAELANLTDNTKVFEVARKADAEMRIALNNVFEKDIADTLFGSCSAFMLSDGLPVWANILLRIIDLTSDSFAEEKKAQNPRIQKYINKYSAGK